MNEQIVIEIPEAAPLLNKLLRMHWRQRRQIQERFAWLARQSLGYAPKKPIQYCTVVIERHSAGLPDWDGLYGSTKIILDCLVRHTKSNPHGIGLIEDDSPKIIRSLQAIPCKAKRGEHKTVIRVFPLEDTQK